MRVIPIASTIIRPEGWNLFAGLGFNPFGRNDLGQILDDEENTDGDILPEFAGRGCYASFHKPNPYTATNQAYLHNTVDVQKHESILEHTSVSFYASEVSRNLLLELERHRHVSLSVISTRYVSQDKFGLVIHPNTPEEFRGKLISHDLNGRYLSNEIYNFMREERGYGVKQAREVARQHLGGNTETKFVATANLRAWRYIINLRNHPKADKEIQLFAAEILRHLKVITPNCVQDLDNA